QKAALQSNVMRLTVIVLCAAAMIGMLVAKKLSKTGAKSSDGASILSREDRLRNLFDQFAQKSGQLHTASLVERREFDQLNEGLRALYWKERDDDVAGSTLERNKM